MAKKFNQNFDFKPLSWFQLQFRIWWRQSRAIVWVMSSRPQRHFSFIFELQLHYFWATWHRSLFKMKIKSCSVLAYLVFGHATKQLDELYFCHLSLMSLLNEHFYLSFNLTAQQHCLDQLSIHWMLFDEKSIQDNLSLRSWMTGLPLF